MDEQGTAEFTARALVGSLLTLDVRGSGSYIRLAVSDPCCVCMCVCMDLHHHANTHPPSQIPNALWDVGLRAWMLFLGRVQSTSDI